MGTCLGISAAYEATALELNGEGHLFTLEGAKPLAEIAQANLKRLGLENRTEVVTGRFDHTLGATVAAAGVLDYAFVDGRHDEQATVGYFEELLPSMSSQGVLVFDDIGWSPGMERAWAAILESRLITASATVGTSVGIAVLNKGREAP
jgi:predicted O-methyltransferase YrrM